MRTPLAALPENLRGTPWKLLAIHFLKGPSLSLGIRGGEAPARVVLQKSRAERELLVAQPLGTRQAPDIWGCNTFKAICCLTLCHLNYSAACQAEAQQTPLLHLMALLPYSSR